MELLTQNACGSEPATCSYHLGKEVLEASFAGIWVCLCDEEKMNSWKHEWLVVACKKMKHE